ncbi:MAG: flagellar motor switch protein FliM [Phycisphaerales bacterium]
MSEQLGQSEIDSLLSGSFDLAEPDSDVRLIFTRDKRDTTDLEVSAYDFKRPERVSKDQMRALQTLHEAFARNFGAALSGFLRTIVEVRVATCEQMTYGEFIAGLPNPTSFNLITADDLEGQICLEISPLIIYPIIDRLLGGTSEDLFIPQRPMTQIEARLVSNITSRGLAALSEAWDGIRKLEFSVSTTESNPQLVQIVPPNEVVIVIGLETRMSNRAGTMNLCIPYNVIEPIMGELAAQSWFAVERTHRDEKLTQTITSNLSRAPVNVSAVIAETTITLRDLAEMQVGDLIATNRPADHPAVLCVEGEPKYCGFVGRFKGARAIRIDREVRPGDRL